MRVNKYAMKNFTKIYLPFGVDFRLKFQLPQHKINIYYNISGVRS